MNEKTVGPGFSELVGESLTAALTREREFSASGEKQSARRILVAFSGGPDSTALLLALDQMAAALSLELFACHVNHKLRGAESDRDQQFCQAVCLDLKIELTVRTAGDAQAGSSWASENSLRNLRYRILAQVAEELECKLLCTAHTLDDQVETVLFRLFRGTSLSGMRGISALREFDGDKFLVRPLLKLSRSDCVRFLSELDKSACFDSSNADTKYSRNYIRHEIVPQIESRFPGFGERIERLREIIDCDDKFLGQLARAEYRKLEPESDRGIGIDCRWDAQLLPQMGLSVLRRVVALGMQNRGVETSFERVEAIAQMWKLAAPNAVSLNQRWDVRIDASGALLWQDKLPPTGALEQDICDHDGHIRPNEIKNCRIQHELQVPGSTVIPALNLVLHVEALVGPAATEFPRAQEYCALVDLSRCLEPLVVRRACPDDRIQPFGMDVTVRLSKFLHTHKREPNPALALPDFVLADALEVVWVPGIGLSEKLRAGERATHRLVVMPMFHEESNG